MPSQKSDKSLCPPLPGVDRDHQIIRQLDYINRDSEEKMVQIFDMLEDIHAHILEIGETAVRLEAQIGAKRLNRKKLAAEIGKLERESGEASDNIIAIMDMLQYQDFHRQRIERVVNQMRGVANYIQVLFASEIDDSRRSSSAHFIQGDEADEDLMSEEEMAALVEAYNEELR
ncbi:MAG: hypothetical protein B6D59_07040 [Campylobacteraceae bacterium 4484_4]|nr:MAG: hypothetical protein B6D59_07040 [Campylobacteraceae bacterium 4484_4]